MQSPHHNTISKKDRKVFKLERNMHVRMLKKLDKRLQIIEVEPDTDETYGKLSKYIHDFGSLIRTKNTQRKRENIEKRGYDTNARISERDDMENRETKQHNTNKTLPDCPEKTDPEGDIKPEQQPDVDEQPVEKAQELKHLHSDMKEYQDSLPEPIDTEDNAEHEQKKLPSIIKQKPPTITYNPNGFCPHGQMRDLFKSHATVKIVGGTYDAGKTYSCIAYIDQIARKYPGARLTFIHRSLNRVQRNIIPSYEKYLGFRPKSRSDPNPTPITRYGGEHTEFFEYWNGSRIYINGLDKPDNMLSDFYDAAFVNQAELIPFSTWDQLTARGLRTRRGSTHRILTWEL